MNIRICLIVSITLLFLQCKDEPKEMTASELPTYDLVISNAYVIDIETGTSAKQNLYIIGDRIKLIAPADSMFSNKSNDI